jgi:molybdenum cofactor biosynthesis enzyme MoaA
VPEKTIKMQAWGDIGTDMLKVYVHLTPSDAERDMLKHFGIETDDKLMQKDKTLNLIQCKCGFINPHSNLFCAGCHQVLSAEAANIAIDLINIREFSPIDT